MKAVLCKAWGPPDSLTIETLPDLVPAKGEVVIDVKAAAVNFPDVLIIQNNTRPSLPCRSARARSWPAWSMRSAKGSPMSSPATR